MIGFLVRLNKAKNLTNGHLTGAEEKKGRRGGGKQLANAKANSNSGSGSGRVR